MAAFFETGVEKLPNLFIVRDQQNFHAVTSPLPRKSRRRCDETPGRTPGSGSDHEFSIRLSQPDANVAARL
jgi:hypothetical protein